ncbi:conserved hypothetical protein [Culex quinquefasciatus]|uniref:Ig-like domain-containing protein n=1 Tax=Culex quinquefasciatus TaxID=7176 RepID=B0X7P3_CULQU|nr:conserved hypothetical protein [Culex quinquefasciatus]|eukprot:XP_001865665.1 conserved hypothetical protein [Culex quinquefasciatus]
MQRNYVSDSAYLVNLLSEPLNDTGGAPTSNDGNVTVSELVFVPGPEDNEKSITCSISYNEFGGPTIVLKDSRVLDVKHVPVISLSLGAPLNSQNLMEGSDVYLECDIKANPPAKKIEWFHNNKLLQSARGIIISNQTLVLQSITKATHGEYMCKAANTLGTVTSNQLYLDIKCNYSPPALPCLPVQYTPAPPPPTGNFRQKDAITIINHAYTHVGHKATQTHTHTHTRTHTNSLLLAREVFSSLHGIPTWRTVSRNRQPEESHLPDTEPARDPPVCKSEAQIIRAAVKQTVNITCDIDANPMPNLLFRWQFNNSLESMLELPPYSNIEAESHHQLALAETEHGSHGDSSSSSSHPHHHHHSSQSSSSGSTGSNHNLLVGPNLEEMVRRKLERQQQPPKPVPVDGQLYMYRIESFTSFGTVTCTATNTYGQSGHCLYHILVADVPDPIKSCTISNVTAYTVHVSCLAGKDGGIPQQFHVDIFDENTKKLLFSITFSGPEMLLKKLPSDTKFIMKITPFNLQGTAPTSYRVKAQTLPAPLLRTAPSKAVLVQLTPLLGALVGAAITLFLVAICIIIFVKFKTKKKHHPATNTEQDKGSAEPLSRNIGSHSSIDDKNPDVIPHENSEDDDEKQFERLALDSDRLKFSQPHPPHPVTATPAMHYSPTHLSPTGNGLKKQFGELSLTTNPSYAIYNSPVRSPYGTAGNPSGTTTTTTVLPPARTTSPNIYTRLPLRDFTPNTYDSMLSTSQTSSSGYATSQIYTKMPLLTTNYAEQLASLDK